MDTSDPEIVFDENGVCNHCKQYDARVANEVFPGEEGRRRLAQIVDKIKADGAGREYDCVAGVSGGADSTTVVWAAKRLGLRPLAVHFDNGWNSELAVANIRAVLERLEIDLTTYVVDWEEFRDLQLSFLKASVANSEVPTDHAINAVLYRTAAAHGVKYILGGGNVTTEGILPSSWGWYNLDLRHIKSIHRRFGTARLKTFPTLSIPRLLYYVLVKRIRTIPMLNYLDYNKSEMVRTLSTEFGWRDYGGKHYESVYTRFFQGYILPRKFGFDKRRAHLSTRICAGQLSRKDALAEIARDPYADASLNTDMEFVLKKFGLSASDMRGIMAEPVKSYRDYPSNRLFFERLKHFRQAFKRHATRV